MANPTDVRTNEPLTSVEVKFIQEVKKRLKEKNIINENVYNMAIARWTWQSVLGENLGNIANIEKFKNDEIIAVLCINATNSKKLPFFIFLYNNEEIKKYANSQYAFIPKKETNVLAKQQEIYESWYKNYFMTHVRNHQRETKINNRKVMLLLKKRKQYYLLSEIKDEDFETMFFPEKSHLAPLHHSFIKDFRYTKLRSHEFPNPSNIGDCIKVMCDKWTNHWLKNLTSIYLKRWSNFITDVPIEENNPSTSVVTQTSDKNVIEENTASKEIPEDPQNSIAETFLQEKASMQETLEQLQRKEN
ncbi:uncharacterized protein [Anoplolepis gracilipes]|uniref:uncharacterized protein n=1 Tax=Anoplolepis gracilipes TaxID=354296 RepID=UPI003B9F438E